MDQNGKDQLRSNTLDELTEIVIRARRAGLTLSEIRADFDGMMRVQESNEE